MPYGQINFEVAPVSIVIRSHLEAATLAHSARAAIQSANPNQPLYRTAPLTDFVAASLAPSWFRTAMLGVTAMLGLLIAMVGIHGILGRSILERLREIAIRRALGATTANVALVGLSDAWTSLVAGTACGIPLAMLGLSRLTAAVPDVRGTTMVGLTLGTATVIAMVTAITLTHVPRVLRINTALTLKSE